MAWRDSRTQRARLFLFSLSIVVGIAALAGIGTLSQSMEQEVARQAKTLLGADLELSGRRPFSTNEENLFAKLGGEQAREIAFSSMIYFPNGGGTRLAQIRGVSGGFPFYGSIDTVPPQAATDFRRGAGAVVEENLLIQFGANLGDKIKLGQATFSIIGELKKVTGESFALTSISPRVFVAMTNLPATGLLDSGALARYRVFFHFPTGTDVEQLVETNQAQFDQLRLTVDTVKKREEDLGNAISNFYRFLGLVNLTTLILGGIGVAGAIHSHVKQKLGTAAVLRCLGASTAQTFAVYMAQAMALGAIGAVIGSILGVLAPASVPGVVSEFLPFTFEYHTSWFAVCRAALIGFGLCVLFALLPLLEIRRVSPLAALRRVVETVKGPRDRARWCVSIFLFLSLVAFALAQGPDWRASLGFCGGLLAAFGIFAASAKLLMWLGGRLADAVAPFTVRQGLANLHRPNNRTLLLLLSLGLGVFLMVTIQLLQHTLITQLVVAGGTNEPNAILFDIQPAQEEAVSGIVRHLKLPVLDELPLITMRISSVKGKSVESILADKESRIPGWTLRREYRSTYSDHLRDAEKIIAGTWIAHATNADGPAPISVEKEIAHDLNVGLGDEIIFDVQGAPVRGKIASLREVNWRRVQPNFFVLFPTGVLENAPSMNVLATRINSAEESARLQRAVVREYPNVSVIDVTLIVQSLDSILSKVSFVVQFLALFSVLAGLVVLAGALATGHFQRVQESVLLRTLGASRRQIYRILMVEYLSIGLMAALIGTTLAVIAVWAMAVFLFDTHFVLQPLPLIFALVGAPLVTVSLGLFMSRGVASQPPLAILRSEAN